jgi:hypothetical protein
MNRSSMTSRLMVAKREYATLLDRLLMRGQRPEGEAEKWTNKGFADCLSEILQDPPSEATIRTWRNADTPHSHDLKTLNAICAVLFGQRSQQKVLEDRLRST